MTWVLRNLPPCHLHSCGMQLIPPDLQVSISLRCFKRGLPAQNSGWATHAELRYAEKLLTSCASQPLVRELRVSRPASWNPRSDSNVYSQWAIHGNSMYIHNVYAVCAMCFPKANPAFLLHLDSWSRRVNGIEPRRLDNVTDVTQVPRYAEITLKSSQELLSAQDCTGANYTTRKTRNSGLAKDVLRKSSHGTPTSCGLRCEDIQSAQYPLTRH